MRAEPSRLIPLKPTENVELFVVHTIRATKLIDLTNSYTTIFLTTVMAAKLSFHYKTTQTNTTIPRK